MEGKQKINCTVTTCRYNNQENRKCVLESIQVAPIEGCDTMEADESMCASYEYHNEDKNN